MPQIPCGGIIPLGRNLLKPAYWRRECGAHELTCLNCLQTYIILSHFNTTVGHTGLITASLKNIENTISFLKIKNQPFLSPFHVGYVKPTPLILKCQDLDNYFKPPWLSVCAWRWRQTRVGAEQRSDWTVFSRAFGPAPPHLLHPVIQRFRPSGRRERKCEVIVVLTPRSDGGSRLYFDRRPKQLETGE